MVKNIYVFNICFNPTLAIIHYNCHVKILAYICEDIFGFSLKKERKLKDKIIYLLTVILFVMVNPLQVTLIKCFPIFKFLGKLKITRPYLLVFKI